MKVNKHAITHEKINQPKEQIIIKQLTPNNLNPHWLKPKLILSPRFPSYMIYCNFTLGNLNLLSILFVCLFVFLLPVLLIFVSEKPQGGVDNKF